MKRNDWLIICIFLFLIVIIIILVFICMNLISDIVLFYISKKRLFLSMGNVLRTYFKSQNFEQCIDETKIIMENNVNKNIELRKRYETPVDIYKEVLYLTNEQKYKLDDDMDTEIFKQRILNLIQEYENRNPLEQLEGTDSIILKELYAVLGNEEEVEKGRKILNKLAKEWKEMQDNIYERDISKAKQDKISVISLILSIVFGTMTFIQFFI